MTEPQAERDSRPSRPADDERPAAEKPDLGQKKTAYTHEGEEVEPAEDAPGG